ncbi:MAG: CBS domain-containing protein [Schwartzia sp.]|nr:CBS domain-containing protein [Schwartzia sp. (in: firmicutes)]MBR1761327.1 CBS domain-containing protein [Schwartzia sp. (in: firmicutes)]
MLAKDIMKTDVCSISRHTPIKEIAEIMAKTDISGLPVVDETYDNNVVGVVSELDLMRKEIQPNKPSVWKVALWGLSNSKKLDEHIDAIRKCEATTAENLMTSPAITVDELDDVETVGQLIFEKKIKRVFVTRYGKLVGVISRSAFVKKLLASME